ncbi:RecT family recombinase [Paenibacillus sp. FSL H7-0918]|jgi:recombination protein RecT|uniref:RecT family recombinase n=1 Tax=Paenibacillus sp. FSL H7-0918 TaxID=2921442 RepID=UPI0030FA44AF
MSNTQLLAINDKLIKMIEDKQDAMPKNFNKTRFIQNSMAVLQDTDNIDKCDASSVARTLLKGAFLGLDFMNKECYPIIYGGKCTFQTDYKGEIKLAQKYSVRPVLNIYAELVREGDFFLKEVKDGQRTIQHRPPEGFNNGKVIGAYAVVLYKDGGMDCDSMSVDEIEATRKNYSKQANGPSWTKSPGEMQKKTVLRRLCKNIQLDFDTIEAKQAFEDGGDFDYNKETRPAQESPLNPKSTVIDAEFTEVGEGATDGTE